MKYIALIAVIALLLLEFCGAVPQSSVGGPMTLAVVFFVAALAVGIHEAWSNKRGVLGWIVSIVVALVGAFVGASIGNMVMETMPAPQSRRVARSVATSPPLFVAGPA